MSTEEILADLHKLEEAPWGDLRGKPLDARSLAKYLKPYEVTSKGVRIDGTTPKGYKREDLHDPFARYLPKLIIDSVGEPPSSSATYATTATSSIANHITTEECDDCHCGVKRWHPPLFYPECMFVSET